MLFGLNNGAIGAPVIIPAVLRNEGNEAHMAPNRTPCVSVGGNVRSADSGDGQTQVSVNRRSFGRTKGGLSCSDQTAA